MSHLEYSSTMFRYAVELLSVIVLLLTVAGCSSGHVPSEPAPIEPTPASATSIAPATNTAQRPLSTLDLAESTVKIHVQNIFKKLNMSSRVQVALYAVENGYGQGR